MSFPTTVACVLGETGEYPYYLKASGIVSYNTAPNPGNCFVGAFDNTANNFWQISAILNGINKANPDWLQLLDIASVQSFTGLTGHGISSGALNICFAIVAITTPVPASVDQWWKPSNFGKYGWFAWGTINAKMPAVWINLIGNVILDNLSYWNNFSYTFFPNVIGSVTTYGRIRLPAVYFGGAFVTFPT